jgi:hypothetical protein
MPFAPHGAARFDPLSMREAFAMTRYGNAGFKPF